MDTKNLHKMIKSFQMQYDNIKCRTCTMRNLDRRLKLACWINDGRIAIRKNA